ncbi:MAG: hypothetical protein ACKVZ0_04875 [Gemmatimonadales bacterium]
MKTTLVRYRTLPDRASENEALIHGVFDELRRLAPPGFRYGAFKLADGVSFVHFAMTDAAESANSLTGLESFRRFQADLRARCVDLPVVTELTTQVDSYGLGPIRS